MDASNVIGLEHRYVIIRSYRLEQVVDYAPLYRDNARMRASRSGENGRPNGSTEGEPLIEVPRDEKVLDCSLKRKHER